jgi:hypothetical protein
LSLWKWGADSGFSGFAEWAGEGRITEPLMKMRAVRVTSPIIGLDRSGARGMGWGGVEGVGMDRRGAVQSRTVLEP